MPEEIPCFCLLTQQEWWIITRLSTAILLTFKDSSHQREEGEKLISSSGNLSYDIKNNNQGLIYRKLAKHKWKINQ